MITLGVKVTGLEEVKAHLAQYPKEAPAVYGEALARAGARLRDETKALGNIPVATGRMRQSINSRRISLLAVGVFVGTDYGAYVHEGTARMPARPFFRWALEGGAQKAIDDIFSAASLLIPKK